MDAMKINETLTQREAALLKRLAVTGGHIMHRTRDPRGEPRDTFVFIFSTPGPRQAGELPSVVRRLTHVVEGDIVQSLIAKELLVPHADPVCTDTYVLPDDLELDYA